MNTMKYMKNILAICVMFSALALSGGDFEDFERLAKDVSRQYSSAKGARESSSAEQDFKAKLKEFAALSSKMEEHMKKLSLGRDFEFNYYSKQLEAAFDKREVRNDFDKRGGTIHEIIDPEIMLDHLKHDIKMLKEMDFTVDENGVPSINEKWLDYREFLQYKRLFDFIASESKSITKKAESYSWRKDFQSRLILFSEAGGALDTILRRNNPDYGSKLALARETNAIDSMARTLVEARNGKKVSRMTDISSKYTKDPAAEIQYSINKVETELKKAENELKAASKKRRSTSRKKKNTEPSLTDSEILAFFSASGKAPTPVSDDKNTPEATDENNDGTVTDDAVKDFDRYTAKYRNLSNVMLDGISDGDAEKFKATLTPELKKEFEKKIESAKNDGKSSKRANASAFLAMQNILKKTSFTNDEKAKIISDIQKIEEEKNENKKEND